MFITPEEYDKIFDNEEEFNKVLEKVVQKAVEDTLRVLPSIINSLIVQVASMKEISIKFYEDHKEFKDHKEIVTKVIEDLEVSNPGMEFQKLLNLATPIIQDKILARTKLKQVPAKRPETEIIEPLLPMFEKN